MDGTTVEYSPEIPEPIIHRIQSLLDPKLAAQTTLVSNSWFRAWSTRPTIELNESHFPRDDSSPYPEIDRLPGFAKKTFRRYEDLNLRIDNFILNLRSEWYCTSGLPTKWTSKALKLGATDFTFLSECDIDIPLRVVLESENIVRRLCLEEASISGKLKVIRCMGLKSLALSKMLLSGGSFFDIISCYPLIENLSLSNVATDWAYQDDFDYGQRAGSMISLPNLSSLIVCGDVTWKLQKFFVDYLSSKFPNLKELTIHLKLRYDDVVISSRSLEILDLRANGYSDAKFEIDAPRIRKFTFEGSVMPKFSVRSKTSDYQFESRVSVFNHEGLSANWLYTLSEFLTSMHMAGSTTHLCLHLHCKNSRLDYNLAGDLKCVNVCQVEDLTVETRDLCPSLRLDDILDALIWICNPKVITPYLSPPEKEYCGICDIDENSY